MLCNTDNQEQEQIYVKSIRKCGLCVAKERALLFQRRGRVILGSVRPRILFLTNKRNGAPAEDELLTKFLCNDFELIISHPLDCLPILNTVNGVFIRNIWPTHEYAEDWNRIEAEIRHSGLPTYNPLTGNGDERGKGYLTKLSKWGFPVIPSVEHIQDIALLGQPEYYWIKPKDGCDGSGSDKLTGQALRRRRLTNYIIQPYVEFTSEPSFFFIDNSFSHAIIMPNRLADRDIKQYHPTEEDLNFAQAFVDWNALPYGIQRIDALRGKDDKLLLSEVEDLCPYLYLAEVPEDTQRRFLEAIRRSLLSALS